MRTEEGLVKQEHILEAAIRRFSHFGINKTTLTEIADDLAISKPLLFYYFHDKNSLITAVAGKIIHEFLEEMEHAFQTAASAEEGLLHWIEVKRKHFKKYFLLAIQGDNADINRASASLHKLYYDAREKTAALITSLLNKGMEQRVLKPMDAEKTSRLLLETLTAFEHCAKGRKAIPEMNDIDALFDKEKEVLQLILNGLKKP